MAERADDRSMTKRLTDGERDTPYQVVFGDVSKIVDAAMTAAYWLIGHRIIEFEQSGQERAE